MRRLFLLAAPIAIVGGLLTAGTARVATAAGTGHAPPPITGAFTDKPYTATTPDSGTSGNNWAIDLFTRSFVVSPTSGTTKVVEHFNGGRFITLGDGATGSSASPGVNDSTGNNTHLLAEGVSGSFSGTFTIIVNSGFAYHSGGGCGQVVSGSNTDDGCTTAQWIALNFSGAVYGTDTSTTAYSLTYKATGSGLLGTTWTDASTGDSGDIYTSVS